MKCKPGCRWYPGLHHATLAPDPLDQIRKLKGLLDDKIITQEEFEKKKADLLK
ncbi:SHOCT domain-containing protein [Undibacterium sp. Ji49W]|uniref:SHOCT domain-containing protein n=1 Tax=Undibacterium sp. Ji49W TaxID=3413040 RepID=UPI003BF06D86